MLVEPRARAGGRIITRDDTGAGAPIELGPEFVHGSPAITLDLIRESGGAIVDNGETAFVRSDDALEEATFDAFGDAEALLEAAAFRDADCSVDELLAEAVARGADLAVAERTRALVAGFDAADPARASARAIAMEWTGEASADGTQSRPLGGYGVVVDHLLRGLDPLRVTTRFSSVATAVRLRDERVELDVVRDGRAERVTAAAAIVTVPIGVLQAHPGDPGTIAFDPPLPASHAYALSKLAMGPVCKVVMQFTDRFWETVAGGRFRDGAFFSTDGPFPTIWTQVPVRVPTLTAWAGGTAAQALAALDETALRSAALESVVALFNAPHARERLVAAFVHDWQRDPFSRGAYSYALVDAGDARELLAVPIAGRLWIAGEATANGAEGGTVAGALMSGERAARDVLRTISRA
jgi:monoamine oxidase